MLQLQLLGVGDMDRGYIGKRRALQGSWRINHIEICAHVAPVHFADAGYGGGSKNALNVDSEL